MQIEKHCVLELAPVRKNMNKNCKVLSNVQLSITLQQILIAYTDYIADYCDHMASLYKPALLR